MLGKIAEKLRRPPNEYLDHYEKVMLSGEPGAHGRRWREGAPPKYFEKMKLILV